SRGWTLAVLRVGRGRQLVDRELDRRHALVRSAETAISRESGVWPAQQLRPISGQHSVPRDREGRAPGSLAADSGGELATLTITSSRRAFASRAASADRSPGFSADRRNP